LPMYRFASDVVLSLQYHKEHLAIDIARSIDSAYIMPVQGELELLGSATSGPLSRAERDIANAANAKMGIRVNMAAAPSICGQS